ncbi:MAG: DUF2330 domain-containing protein [Planctomycetes bacterium]|nr:DUF2330 domain-containing protein [Planctomycetota bacterium]
MTRLLVAWGLLLLAAATAFADGGVFPSAPKVQQAALADVRTPDQRAALAWDAAAGIETLVIETTVRGEGTDFAWILPLPAAPTIETSARDLFPVLRDHSPIDVWTDVTPHWLGLLALAAAVLLVPLAPSRGAALVVLGVASLLMLTLLAIGGFGPGSDGLSMTYGDGAGLSLSLPEPKRTTVRVLDRRTVGAFDAAVVTAQEPADLRHWLDENGYVAPASIDPVVAEYVREGWVFVATKLRADATAEDVRNVAPLSFRFPAKEPVYPMRLTGAVNPSLELEMYVFGDRGVEADGLEVTHSTEFDLWGPDAPVARWTSHSEVVRLAGEAKGVTRLVGSFDAGAMSRDIAFRWTDFTDVRPFRFTSASAWTLALDAAAAILFAGAIAVARRTTVRWSSGRFRAPVVGLEVGREVGRDTATAAQFRVAIRFVAAAALAGGAIRMSLPTIDYAPPHTDEEPVDILPWQPDPDDDARDR